MSRRGVVLGVSATALAACAGGGGKFINVYTARHDEADRALYSAFQEATGIEVRALFDGDEPLLERLRVEANQTEADVFISMDAGVLWQAKEAGLLQNVMTPDLQQKTPEHLRDPDGAYWGFAKRPRGIVYRKDAVQPNDVATMDALGSTRFRHQIAMGSASHQLSALAARIERAGADNARAWVAAVRANFAHDPQANETDSIKAVAAGDAQATVCNHADYIRLLRSQDAADHETIAKVGFVFPDQAGAGAPINISGAGVTAHTQRRDLSVQFLNYLASDEAQAVLAPLSAEFPIRADIAPAADLAAAGAFKEEDTPLDALGRRREEAAQIFADVGWS